MRHSQQQEFTAHMNDSEFNQQVDTLLLRIEEQAEQLAEQLDEDMDWESGQGMLKLDFPRGKLIFSRQSAVHQLWLAAPDTGYHCNWDGGDWRCDKSGETVGSLLARYSEQLCGKAIEL
jgi:CyaY protein